MAARKKRATTKTGTEAKAAKSEPKSASRPVAAGKATEPKDPRRPAFRAILLAKANKQGVPRDIRVYDDPFYTGELRAAQVEALMFVGKTAEEAVDAIVEGSIQQAKAEGRKHSGTL